jgi:hypothetical protein
LSGVQLSGLGLLTIVLRLVLLVRLSNLTDVSKEEHFGGKGRSIRSSTEMGLEVTGGETLECSEECVVMGNVMECF